jgi:hypothetical protein
VALLHLAQLTYVSEMAVRRVPRTSSCMADTCLSLGFNKSKQHAKPELFTGSVGWMAFKPTRFPLRRQQSAPASPPTTRIDYGTPSPKLQGRLTTFWSCATMSLYTPLVLIPLARYQINAGIQSA